MSKAGRPTDCNEARIEKICAAARAGVPLRRLHDHGGISNGAFWNWIKRGEAGIAPYAGFVERLKASRASRELRCLQVMTGEVPADVVEEGQDAVDAWAAMVRSTWQRTAWVLERSYGYRRDAPPDAPPLMEGTTSAEEAVARLAEQVPAAILRAALDAQKAA